MFKRFFGLYSHSVHYQNLENLPEFAFQLHIHVLVGQVCLGKICAATSLSVTLFFPPGDALGFAGDLWPSFNVSEY